MADALCGPSNPLQNLQKHTQVDRTLQQDRLVGPRQSPGQGFRTADPRAGSLDADFYAFENASPGPFQHRQPEFANALPTTFSPLQQQPSFGPAGWAADFQRMNLHDRQPLPAGQFRTEAPLVKSTIGGGWQNEFMRQRPGAASPVAQGKQAAREPPQMDMTATNTNTSFMGYSSMAYQSYGGNGMYRDGAGFEQQQEMPGMSSVDQQHFPMSDVDFDAAFQEAIAHAREMDQLRETAEVSESVVEESVVMGQTESVNKIGSDAIQYRERTERTEDQDSRDADELARTAGQLLTSVQHDTSDKFQNSQFLDLMRRIRDRQVEVQNNDLQDVSTGQAATSTPVSLDSILQPELQYEAQKEMEALNLHENLHENRQRQQQQEQRQPQQETQSHFEFPDMDAVYAPAEIGRHSPYTNYGFDDDGSIPAVAMQPRRQVDDVHPGGKWYPDQSPQMRTVPLASRQT
ncbi:hypothetical protein H2204_006632 [Knufia peltigerae]|uniref:Peroxin 20 n=1 Tax=Knufia peltigerae TaxID=1002370 RepID=A0AA38Y4M6_9EURO|nr:hypothetical protein H2204_006632 [Knufia peltigerae]